MDMEKNEAALFHEGQRNDALIAALNDFPIFLNSSELTTEERLMKYIAHVCANLKDVDFQNVGFKPGDLFHALMSYTEYYNNDIPDRERLVALGGYVAHVCKAINDEQISEKILTELFAAVDFEVCKPVHKEVNAMWQEWNYPKTGEYDDVEKRADMMDICIKKIDEYYPGYLNIFAKWFALEMEEQ